MFASRSSPYLGYQPEHRRFPVVAPQYGYEVDKETGRRVVVKVGDTNFQQRMQAALPDTLIYNVIDKINRTGDFSLLGDNLGGFIDVTDMPRNLLEASCVRVKSEQLFNALPYEERSKYQNDVNIFVKSVNEKLKAKTSRSAVLNKDTSKDISKEASHE